jgi:hypothetical protein
MSNSVEAVVISYPLTYIRANGATGTQTVTQAITKVKTGTLGIRGSRQLYSTDAAYTSTYDFDGAGATTAGAASYAARATQLIAAATAGSNPTTPINGDTVTFTNGTNYVYTITHNGTAWSPPGTVIDGSLLVTGSVTAAKINSNGLTIRDTAGNIILSAGASLATSSLNLPGTISNVPTGWQNSAITLGANGSLSGAGGGAVTIGGLGYTGALNATFGKSLALPFTSWNLGSQPIVYLSDAKVGSLVLRLFGSSGYPNQGNYIPIDPAKTYRTRFWARPSSNNTAGLLYFSLRQFLDNTGTAGSSNGGRNPYKPGGVSRATHITTYGDTWGEYSFLWTASDWQAGAKFVQPEFLDNYSGAAGFWEIQDFSFEEVTETVLAQTTADGKLSKSAADILSSTISVNAVSGAGFRAGNLTWDATGARTGGQGVAMTPGGLIGHNGTKTTFAVNATTGDAIFAGNISGATGTFNGSLAVGTNPAISGNSMTGSGAIINSNGTFALGNTTRNITFNATGMRVNGSIVDISNLIPGASLPDYVRTYKGGVTPTITVNAWMPLQLDPTALNNKLGATDHDAYRTILPAGTYFYELSVPAKCNGSDTNDACYTAIISYPPGTTPGSTQTVCGYVGGGTDPKTGNYIAPTYQCWQEYIPFTPTVLSTAGVNVVGDWQTATIFGVGRFTISTPTYIAAAILTTDGFPSMQVVARSNYSSTILRIWRDTSV